MQKNIVETAREAEGFTTPLTALDAAGLEPPLREQGPFTDIEASNGIVHVIDRELLPAAA